MLVRFLESAEGLGARYTGNDPTACRIGLRGLRHMNLHRLGGSRFGRLRYRVTRRRPTFLLLLDSEQLTEFRQKSPA